VVAGRLDFLMDVNAYSPRARNCCRGMNQPRQGSGQGARLGQQRQCLPSAANRGRGRIFASLALALIGPGVLVGLSRVESSNQPSSAPTVSSTAAPLPGGSTAPDLAETAVITGQVVLLGIPPPEVPLPVDPTCGLPRTRLPRTTRFYVVGPEGGLADVVVFIRSGLVARGYRPPTKPLLIDQVGCEFVPYVAAVMTGQTICVRNSDAALHNVHFTASAAGNRPFNRMMSPRSTDLTVSFRAEERFLRLKCDLHPWMFAYVTVLPHPFFAVTDANGAFRIVGLPSGEYVVKALHRKAGGQSRLVKVRAGETTALNFSLSVDGQLQSRQQPEVRP
jgi:hypothetical protein